MTPEEFKAAIYAGGADDKVATDRGIEILTNMGMSPEEGLAFWNQALGTQLTNDDMTGALAARVPENFEDYIYAGGANDMIATDRGIDLLEQHQIPFDEALGLWNESLGTDLGEDTALEAIAVRDPEEFKEFIYKDGANDRLATDRGIKAMIDHQIPFDRALDLWNQSLGTSFSLGDANKALQERSMQAVNQAATSSPYTSYLKGDKGAIVGSLGGSSQDTRGLQTIGGNGPQNFFSLDAPYSSTLIKALRQSMPNAGNMNPGVSMLENHQTSSGGGLEVAPPPSGLSNNVQPAPPPPAYVPPAPGEEDRDGVDDSGGNASQQVLNSGYSNSYFQANPDVANMYELNFKDSMTPDAYAMEHWLNYGQTEGRDGWLGPVVNPVEAIFGSGNGSIYADQP